MQLPSSLAPYANILQMFSEDSATVIATLLQRMAHLLGMVDFSASKGDKTPDGISGLTNKGDFEHLVLSEWLMAEEIPDEFLRRLSMGELQFYKSHTIAHDKLSISAGLFDIGPMQLGAPRILHIVVLILLAQRAKLRNIKFIWGCIQNPEILISDALDQESILKLLAARSSMLVSEQNINTWQKTLNEYGNLAEYWLISQANFTAAKKNWHNISISEPPSVDKRLLSIDYKTEQQIKQIEIELPQSNSLVHIIRNPFDKLNYSNFSITKKHIKAEKALIFSGNARKLAIALADGGLALYSIPNSNKETLAKPKIFTSKFNIVAAAIYKKRLMVISKNNRELRFHNFPDMINVPAQLNIHSSQQLDFNNTDGRVCQFYFCNNSILFVDARANLRSLIWNGRSKLFTTIQKNIVGIAQYYHKIFYAYRSSDSKSITIVYDAASKNPVEKVIAVESVVMAPVFFYSLFSIKPRKSVTVAVPVSQLRWHVFDENRHFKITVDRADTVIGVAWSWKHKINQPFIVTIDKNKRQFNLYSEQQVSSVPATDDISFATVCQHKPQIAYQTENNELCVYSILKEQRLLHLYSGNKNE